MAKFVYRMQNILDLKLKLEEQAKIAFSLANAALREEEHKLEIIYEEMHMYEQKLKNAGIGSIDIMELKRCSEAIEIKKQHAKEQQNRIKIAERNVELARMKLNSVMIERKTQEILREKAFEEFKKEINEEEKKVTDELTSYQYNGNRKEINHA